MKNIRKKIALVLALILTATLSSSVALAAKPKTVTMKMGAWYTLKSEKKIDTIFKLNLKTDCLLTCSTQNPKNKEDILEFELYNSKACNWDGYVGGFGASGGGTSKEILAVSKGTYYLKAYTHSGAAKLKITSKTFKKPANTMRSKALTLEKGAETTVIQVPTGPNQLWYKIKLTKKQFITVDFDEWSGYFHPGVISIYNAKNKKVVTLFSEDEYLYKTKARQSAGTYYICVQKPQEYKTGQGGYMELYWR